jgi:CheY-like chemotaxis protein
MAEVLVIEDDRVSRELIFRILSSEGHSVIVAENGAVGLKKLAQSRIDIVFTDLLMPVLEGLETIREIRRVQSHVKIIAISGVYADYLEAALLVGADAILRKPFSPSVLRETIAAIASGSSEESKSRVRRRIKAAKAPGF